ncbi:MAG: hypothetical protein LCI00_28540 [Chloroflexi bacterium]|nr:hypothetical protein [Chloroflexota bacterium]MCC6894484.1 hypothetical protein [Anaerolineae bacterium]
MSEPKTQKRIYTILGLLALLYTVAGTFITFSTSVDNVAGYQYDILSDPIALGIIVLITGIPLFLLFLFLERRATRNGKSLTN